MAIKLCFLTSHPFWEEPLGCGSLIRNRYNLLKSLVDDIVVLYIAPKPRQCPLPNITFAFHNQLTLEDISQINASIKKQKFDVIYSSYNFLGKFAVMLLEKFSNFDAA